MNVDPTEVVPAFAVADSPPRKVAAGALFFDSDHRLLLVKPTYREGWLIPGGLVEQHESPRKGCIREVREELGIDCELGRLLCIDYAPAGAGRDEALKMIFLGGTLSPNQVSEIRLPINELESYEFCDRLQAASRLIPHLDARVAQSLIAFDENRTIYCENGVEDGAA